MLRQTNEFEQDEDLDYSGWTEEEMDLLAAETADILARDGLDVLG